MTDKQVAAAWFGGVAALVVGGLLLVDRSLPPSPAPGFVVGERGEHRPLPVADAALRVTWDNPLNQAHLADGWVAEFYEARDLAEKPIRFLYVGYVTTWGAALPVWNDRERGFFIMRYCNTNTGDVTAWAATY